MPTTYHLPAALILLAGGLLACFAGYRLFRLVLGIYGFILGALFAGSLVSPGTTTTLIVALVGGILGAVALTLGYFLGVALVGGGLGALVAHTVWAQQGWGNPHALPLLAFGIGGAVLALVFQRYVIILGTAVGGAWTALVGGLAMLGDPAAADVANTPHIWTLYPLNPSLARPWFTAAWLALAVIGVVAQLRGGTKRK